MFDHLRQFDGPVAADRAEAAVEFGGVGETHFDLLRALRVES